VGTGPELPCPGGSVEFDPGEILVDPEIYVKQVAELKADLQEALQQIEIHEKEIADVAKPGG
jgi:hypothetical protein